MLNQRQFARAIQRHYSTAEYAFEIASSRTRFGRGVTKEVGHDLVSIGANKRVCIFTDKNIAALPSLAALTSSLDREKVSYDIYTDISVEPTDKSMLHAASYCREKQFDAFIALGGGSVMDTAKAANLYMCNPDAGFLDFVNSPIGRGQPIVGQLKPLIALPTTAGTGSETTGVAIFDHERTGAKTGIRDRALRPTLGLIDPEHTYSCPSDLTTYTGLDVFCHALESYTAIPYHNRGEAPQNPIHRPAYQGSNPISDIWSRFALEECVKYLQRAVEDNDLLARERMCYASSSAGVGFGSAGVHLCHAMSYPIASRVKTYRPPPSSNNTHSPSPGSEIGYPHASKAAIIPHGLSVVITAPEVFRFTAPSSPRRHMEAALLIQNALLASSSSSSSSSFTSHGHSGLGGIHSTYQDRFRQHQHQHQHGTSTGTSTSTALSDFSLGKGENKGENKGGEKAGEEAEGGGEEAGRYLSDSIRSFLDRFRPYLPNGLAAMGYAAEDVPMLVEGTLPQRKVIDVSPRQVTAKDIGGILTRSMTLF